MFGEGSTREIYARRAERLLQPTFVRYCWSLANGDELQEVTRSQRDWRLLLTNAPALSADELAISEFREGHPEALVGVVCSAVEQATLATSGVVILRSPRDEDAWLRMFQELLVAARRAGTD